MRDDGKRSLDRGCSMQIVKNQGRIGQGGFGNVDRVVADDGKDYACKSFSQN